MQNQGIEWLKKKERQSLKDYTRIVVETNEENPITIAVVTVNEIQVADGYRVRLTPQYN